jgi:hypothetical protein
MKWQPEPASEPGYEVTIFQALGSAQIMIQMAYYQVRKTDHWQEME